MAPPSGWLQLGLGCSASPIFLLPACNPHYLFAPVKAQTKARGCINALFLESFPKNVLLKREYFLQVFSSVISHLQFMQQFAPDDIIYLPALMTNGKMYSKRSGIVEYKYLWKFRFCSWNFRQDRMQIQIVATQWLLPPCLKTPSYIFYQQECLKKN